MSDYRDGLKLKTTEPGAALLKLLRRRFPDQSLSALRARVQNREYIYLTDQEKSWADGDRKLAGLLGELERAGFEAELYREHREGPGRPWTAEPMDREFFRNTLQRDREILREVLLDTERETEGFVSREALAHIEETLREQEEEGGD